MARIEITDLHKSFGSIHVLKDITLTVEDGEFAVLVGPSGCGKSTLLRVIAGLEDLTGGELRIGGALMNDVAPRDRDIAMVFQSYALYPHLDVARNMGYALEIRRQPKARIAAAISEAADDPRPDPAARPPSPGAVRRPAAARRHGPRHRAPPQGLPVRRAALEPRRAAARGDAHRDRQAAPRRSAPPRSTSHTTRSRR